MQSPIGFVFETDEFCENLFAFFAIDLPKFFLFLPKIFLFKGFGQRILQPLDQAVHVLAELDALAGGEADGQRAIRLIEVIDVHPIRSFIPIQQTKIDPDAYRLWFPKPYRCDRLIFVPMQ
jgi:hypothetical protein